MGQELTAAADRLELQDEEAQAEHGSHLLQLTGAKLETLPGRASIGGDYAECRQGEKGRKVSWTHAHHRYCVLRVLIGHSSSLVGSFVDWWVSGCITLISGVSEKYPKGIRVLADAKVTPYFSQSSHASSVFSKGFSAETQVCKQSY